MATRAVHRPASAVAAFLAVAAVVTVAGCGSSGDAPNSTDRAFLAQMIPHHERAIAVARVGVTGANDPRVRAFASRIVREQSPELARMRKSADGLKLDLADGARMAHDRISDAQLRSLRTLRGTAFDRTFLQLHITSETGAAEMAEDEIHGGRNAGALDIAKPIATAPQTQIPELRRLLATLTR